MKRIADSIRIADSLIISRYREAETVLKAKKDKGKDTVTEISEMSSMGYDTFKTDTDIFSTRQIILSPDNPYFFKVDSLPINFYKRISER